MRGTSQGMAAEIRWMIRRDLDSVMSIEERCHRVPWTEFEMRECLKTPSNIAVVSEVATPSGKTAIIAFMIYALQRGRFEILNVAVDPEHQRQGHGRSLMTRLKNKLSSQDRARINRQDKRGESRLTAVAEEKQFPVY